MTKLIKSLERQNNHDIMRINNYNNNSMLSEPGSTKKLKEST